MTDRTIQRHIEELVNGGLLTKEERPGYTNLLYIEDVSDEEARRYEGRFARSSRCLTVSPDERFR